ncbi:MAG: tRNA modification GTPase MnmE [Gemmatales bacterium]|nr:MAG: tRNA modification GTPase MnmE [Gemmatales bacterium]
MNKAENTWAARLTPPGKSAVATIALFGPDAGQVARELFRRRNGKTLPDDPPAGTFYLGQFGGELADQVVLAVKEPGMNSLEIHCHGGPEVVDLILEQLADRGVRCCSWQDFLQRTSPSKLQSLASMELAKASTLRTADLLLDQYHGAFERAVVEVLTRIERGDTDEAKRRLDELNQFGKLGSRLTQPWRIAILGPVNAGKSSLVNALVGFQRSIVASAPGTTRDILAATIAIDGWPVELLDTAGWREQPGELEKEGIEQAKEIAANADLIIWLVEAGAEPVWPPQTMASLLVINKIDLPPVWDVDAVDALKISAKTKAGLEELCALLAKKLVPTIPTAGTAIPFTSFLAEAIEQACDRASQGDWDAVRQTLDRIACAEVG